MTVRLTRRIVVVWAVLLAGGALVGWSLLTRRRPPDDWTAPALAQPRAAPFDIVVKPRPGEIEVNRPFEVELRVVNASPTPQSFGAMSCSWYSQWASTNPSVSMVVSGCWENIPRRVTLAPGEAYVNTLRMKAAATGQVSFGMGFTPLLESRGRFIPPGGSLGSGKRTYWSDEVTISVKR